MTDIYGSDRDAGKQEPEVEEISGSRFDRGADLDDRGLADTDVVDADVIGDELDDDTTEIISGASPEFADVKDALAQRDEYLDSLRRLQAEFENYKKRVTKQQSDQVARAATALVSSLLPVLDTLDLATEHIGDEESVDGRALLAVAGQLHDVLAKEGLERDYPLGVEFDPNAHEAVGHLPDEESVGGGSTEGSGDKQVVGQVMRAGYRWRGAVVRPAMVMVRG